MARCLLDGSSMRLFLTLGLAALLACPRGAAAASEFVPGELVVRWAGSARATPATSDALLAGANAQWRAPGSISFPEQLNRAAAALSQQRIDALRTRALARSTLLLRLKDKSRAATLAAIAQLRARADVVFAEPNYLRRTFLKPNDAHYPLQWSLTQAKLEAAWNLSTGSSKVVVAVVDTGVRPHPDLDGRLLKGYDFISDDGSANDEEAGRDADPTDTGSNALSGSAQHGMHVAGIIAAKTNNGEGIAGVDWACKLLPVRALGISGGKGTDRDIADGIRWAAGLPVSGVATNPNPADVINLSFGGEGESTILNESVKDAIAAGAIVVAAAGNEGGNADNVYPAAIDGVLTVGALTYDAQRAPYSNYGKVVDLMAGGGSLVDTLPFEHEGKQQPAGIVSTMYLSDTKEYTYRLYEGTSQAAPLVAGIAALMRATYPELTPAKAIEILRATADPAGKCAQGCGAGALDAAAALRTARELSPNPPPPPAGSDGLPFASKCSSDGDCISNTCQAVDSYRLCTLYCSSAKGCPNGAVCTDAICVPNTMRSAQSINPGHTIVSGTITGGCALAHPSPPGQSPASPLPCFVWLCFGLLVLRRRGHR